MSRWFRKEEEAQPEPEQPKVQEKSLDERMAEVTASLETKFSARMDEMLGHIERMQDQWQQPQRGYTPPVQDEPEDPDVSEDELVNAINGGQGTQAIRKMITKEAKALAKTLIRDHIDPLRTAGLGAIDELSREVHGSKMEYYKRYEKEIDQYLAQVDPGLRVNPQMRKLAYEAVVGRHVNEIAQEKAEEAIRKQGQDTVVGVPSTKAGARALGQDKIVVPMPEDLGGADAEKALREVGRDQEQFAKKLGYKNWEDYMTKCAKYIEA